MFVTMTVIADRCTLCGSTEHEVLCSFPELTWVRCSCSLIYKTREEMAPEVYQQEYYVNKPGARRPYDTRQRRRVGKSKNQILDLLNHVGPGPMLDVGCATGYTLQAAHDLGLDATGVDISEHAVARCRERGFKAEVGTMDGVPFPDAAFQLVVMKHVLEHTPRPREALAEIRRVLRPGGGVYLAVPHAGYAKSLRDPGVSRYYIPTSHGREHFVYYTPATLSRLLREEGFEPVRCPHPDLWHRRAPFPARLGKLAVAPLRLLGQRVREALGLYKEFSVVGVRR